MERGERRTLTEWRRGMTFTQSELVRALFFAKSGEVGQSRSPVLRAPPPTKVPSPTYCTRGGGEKGGGGTVEEGSANNREKSRKERVGKDGGFFGMCGRDSSLWLFRLWRDGFGRWGGRESTIAGRLFNFPPFSFDPPLLFPRRRAHRKKWRRKQEGEFLQELKKAL